MTSGRIRTLTNDPRQAPTPDAKVQTIPIPTEDNTIEVLTALKEAIETLANLRGQQAVRAVTFKDLSDLGIVEILPNGAMDNKLPFGVASANTLGMFKWCDGEKDDYGQGLGWYFLGNDNKWQFITSTPA